MKYVLNNENFTKRFKGLLFGNLANAGEKIPVFENLEEYNEFHRPYYDSKKIEDLAQKLYSETNEEEREYYGSEAVMKMCTKIVKEDAERGLKNKQADMLDKAEEAGDFFAVISERRVTMHDDVDWLESVFTHENDAFAVADKNFTLNNVRVYTKDGLMAEKDQAIENE